MAESEPRTSRARGFALYVGLSEQRARAAGRELGEVQSALRECVHRLAPEAEVHSALVVTGEGRSGDDLHEVRLALGEPGAVAGARRAAAEQPGLVIDLTRTEARIDLKPVRLTDTEFRLIELLVRRPGRVLSRQQLHDELGGGEAAVPLRTRERTIDAHISHLRGKLAEYGEVIRTVPGTGYRFDRHPDVTVIDPPLDPLDWN